MRLFIAVDLPASAADTFKTAQEGIKGCRCSLAKQFHLTLKFLGEVPEYKLEELKLRLAAIAEKHFLGKTSCIGVFPNMRNIRVVWAGLEPKESFAALNTAVENSLSGFFPREPGFVPHITLARVKLSIDKAAMADSVNKIVLPEVSFTVDKLVLKKSTLTPKGPIYEDLLEVKLAGG